MWRVHWLYTICITLCKHPVLYKNWLPFCLFFDLCLVCVCVCVCVGRGGGSTTPHVSASGTVYLFCWWDHVSSIDHSDATQVHDIHQAYIPIHLFTHINGQLFTARVAVWMCESAKSTCAVALAVFQLFVCCALKFLQACVVWQFKNEAATQLALLWIWMLSAGDCTEAIKHFLV